MYLTEAYLCPEGRHKSLSKTLSIVACFLKVETRKFLLMNLVTLAFRKFIILSLKFSNVNVADSRSQWTSGLRRGSEAAHLLRLWVRFPPGAWIFVCCECCVLSGRGLCDELITRPEESYRLWCVVMCDLETSRMRRPWPNGGC